VHERIEILIFVTIHFHNYFIYIYQITLPNETSVYCFRQPGTARDLS